MKSTSKNCDQQEGTAHEISRWKMKTYCLSTRLNYMMRHVQKQQSCMNDLVKRVTTLEKFIFQTNEVPADTNSNSSDSVKSLSDKTISKITKHRVADDRPSCSTTSIVRRRSVPSSSFNSSGILPKKPHRRRSRMIPAALQSKKRT